MKRERSYVYKPKEGWDMDMKMDNLNEYKEKKQESDEVREQEHA